MPYLHFIQPEVLVVNERIRLRKYDGNYEQALAWYQDPIVYKNSEGIFDDSKKPDTEYVKGMYEWLDNNSELYFIEYLSDEKYICIGDVAIKPENPPIVIGRNEYRGKGIGFLVMKKVIERLKTMGFEKISGSLIYEWNIPSIRFHEKLGYKQVGKKGNELIYELEIQ